ncbi:redoxin domain-containing protein [Salibacterium salarium]|uniref:redoxin domain-containing protein n=1 Tax=Salibacterium salarium TaxID=284579 RepID=UPI0027D894C2|nr:redoxin domain-containing protein [Salibacterium salarium]
MSQLVQLQENIDQFEDVEADIYTISSDSPEAHQNLKNQEGFTFTMLSDPSLNVIEKADMAGDQMSVRGYSVFDKDGKLITSEENDFWGDNIDNTEEKIREALE